jgi:carbamoylphosphate synthase large subunit
MAVGKKGFVKVVKASWGAAGSSGLFSYSRQEVGEVARRRRRKTREKHCGLHTIIRL